MRLLIVTLLVALCQMDMPKDAAACGGPDYGNFGALAPLDSSLGEILHPDAEWAAWGSFDREQFRFLYPFKKERGAKRAPLWAFAHEGAQAGAPPSEKALAAAKNSGKGPAIEREAARVVSEWLDMPAAQAAEHASIMWRAVADYEGHAFRAAAQPRLASVRLWAAMHAMKQKIPDGYSDAIRKQVQPKTFRELQKHFDGWLSLYPKHPLAEWVTLFKLRIFYFEGNNTAAWQVLLDMYPRRLPRVLGEMRYLLLMDRQPSVQQVDALRDPVLITALATKKTINQLRFEKWWKLSTAAGKKATGPGTQSSAAWAVNLQERLLAWAAAQKTLPQAFPSGTLAPSPLWGKLRGVALAKAGRYSEAVAQLKAVPTDGEQARLLSSVHWRAGQSELAARVPQASEDLREYIVRTELGTAALKQAAHAGSADPLSKDAAQELSARLAAQGKWIEAARVGVLDRNKKRLWTEAARLSARPDGQLRFARFLVANSGSLFFPERSSFYRGLSSHYQQLAAGSKARATVEAAITRGSERWIALRLFTSWLEKHPRHPNARGVLAEADAQYVLLTNFGGGNYFFWGSYAKASPLAKRLRAVGKLVRQP